MTPYFKTMAQHDSVHTLFQGKADILFVFMTRPYSYLTFYYLICSAWGYYIEKSLSCAIKLLVHPLPPSVSSLPCSISTFLQTSLIMLDIPWHFIYVWLRKTTSEYTQTTYRCDKSTCTGLNSEPCVQALWTVVFLTPKTMNTDFLILTGDVSAGVLAQWVRGLLQKGYSITKAHRYTHESVVFYCSASEMHLIT